MAKTVMPRDDNSQSIPVLRFRAGSAQSQLVTSSSSVLFALSEGTRVITVCVSEPCYFETGGVNISASSSSHYIPSQIPYDIALGSGLSSTLDYHSYIALRAVASSARVYISERE